MTLEIQDLKELVTPSSLSPEEEDLYASVMEEVKVQFESLLRSCSEPDYHTSSTLAALPTAATEASSEEESQVVEEPMSNHRRCEDQAVSGAQSSSMSPFLIHMHRQILEKRESVGDKTSVASVLVYGNFDVFTPTIHNISNSLSSDFSLKQLEKDLTKIFAVLNDSAQPRDLARQKAQAKSESKLARNYPITNLGKSSLATALHIFSENEDEDKPAERTTESQAELAIKNSIEEWEEFTGKKDRRSWERKISMADKKSFIALCGYLLVIVRMCHQITLNIFAEAIKNKQVRAQFIQDLASLGVTDLRESLMTITELYETKLLPNAHANSPLMVTAYRLHSLIMEKIKLKPFLEYAANAELQSACKPFHDLSSDEIDGLEFSEEEQSFLSHDNNWTHRNRRTMAATMFEFMAFSRVYAHSLTKHSLGDDLPLSILGKDGFSFILCLLPPSSFKNKKLFKLLRRSGAIEGNIDANLKQELKRALVDCGIEKRCDVCLKAFKNSHIFVDISDDIANENMAKYDMMVNF